MLAAVLTPSRRIAPGRARRFAGSGIHPSLEVTPTLLGGLNLCPRQLPRRLREYAQENDQAAGAAVEHPVVIGAHMAAKLSQLALDLRAMRERQMRHRVGKTVEAVDLAHEGGSALGVEAVEKFADWLAAVGGPVVDRLERTHHAPALRRILPIRSRLGSVAAFCRRCTRIRDERESRMRATLLPLARRTRPRTELVASGASFVGPAAGTARSRSAGVSCPPQGSRHSAGTRVERSRWRRSAAPGGSRSGPRLQRLS